MTEWFLTLLGVRQGDNLSPTLFAIFINDLLVKIKHLNLGVKFNDSMVSCLAFADDIVLLADSEENLQIMLNTLDDWCSKFQLLINVDKSNVVHFRRIRKARSNYQFKLGKSEVLSYVSCYKYLGIIMNEHLNNKETIRVLANSAGRALGSVIAKFKSLNDLGLKSYTKMYHSGVASILDYCAGVWV